MYYIVSIISLFGFGEPSLGYVGFGLDDGLWDSDKYMCEYGGVAQRLEHGIHNAGVGGSNPPVATSCQGLS